MFIYRPLLVEVKSSGDGHLEGLKEFAKSELSNRLQHIEENLFMSPQLWRFKNNESDVSSFLSEVGKTIPQLDHDSETLSSFLATLFCTKVVVSSIPLGSFMILFEESDIIPKDIQSTKLSNSIAPKILRPFDLKKASGVLFKRPEAARLMAEAISSRNPAGQLSGYVRLFEAGFCLPHHKLKSSLHRFLSGNDLGYSREESDKWIDTRHAVVHGDKLKRGLLFDSDAFALCPRAQQAAFDLIVNKKDWGNPSYERAETGALASRFLNIPTPSLQLTQGVNPRIKLTMSDTFNRYPVYQREGNDYGHLDLMVTMLKIEESIGSKFVSIFTQLGYESREDLIKRKQCKGS